MIFENRVQREFRITTGIILGQLYIYIYIVYIQTYVQYLKEMKSNDEWEIEEENDEEKDDYEETKIRELMQLRYIFLRLQYNFRKL